MNAKTFLRAMSIVSSGALAISFASVANAAMYELDGGGLAGASLTADMRDAVSALAGSGGAAVLADETGRLGLRTDQNAPFSGDGHPIIDDALHSSDPHHYGNGFAFPTNDGMPGGGPNDGIYSSGAPNRSSAFSADWNISEASQARAISVPEPTTWALLLLGFAGLGLAGYRGASKKAAVG